MQELVDRGINTFAMHSGLSEEDFGWGSPTFHKMVISLTSLSRVMFKLCDATLGLACQEIWKCKLKAPVKRLVHNHMQGREKIHLIETFTDMGFDILVSDVDTVW